MFQFILTYVIKPCNPSPLLRSPIKQKPDLFRFCRFSAVFNAGKSARICTVDCAHGRRQGHGSPRLPASNCIYSRRRQWRCAYCYRLYFCSAACIILISEKEVIYDERANCSGKTISLIQEAGLRPSCCCTPAALPCASYVLEYLSPYFDISIFYFNPNIYPPQEYSRRLEELRRMLKDMDSTAVLIEGAYEPHIFPKLPMAMKATPNAGRGVRFAMH